MDKTKCVDHLIIVLRNWVVWRRIVWNTKLYLLLSHDCTVLPPASVDWSPDSSPLSTPSSLLAFLLLGPFPLQGKYRCNTHYLFNLDAWNILFLKYRNSFRVPKYISSFEMRLTSRFCRAYCNVTNCRLWFTGGGRACKVLQMPYREIIIE